MPTTVTSSSIGNEVVIYDSRYSGSELSSSLTHQLAIICRTWSEETEEGEIVLNVDVDNVQQQVGVNDCRLFAIAFAVHAALGESVDRLSFDQSKMRNHLIKCFTKKKMLPFPTLQKRCSRNNFFPGREMNYIVCALCQKDMVDMIECDNCRKWLHLKCMNLTQHHHEIDVWHCQNCR